MLTAQSTVTLGDRVGAGISGLGAILAMIGRIIIWTLGSCIFVGASIMLVAVVSMIVKPVSFWAYLATAVILYVGAIIPAAVMAAIQCRATKALLREWEGGRAEWFVATMRGATLGLVVGTVAGELVWSSLSGSAGQLAGILVGIVSFGFIWGARPALFLGRGGIERAWLYAVASAAGAVLWVLAYMALYGFVGVFWATVGGAAIMSALQVPYGTDPDGQLVSPQDAVKGHPYLCPGCGEPLLFKAGAIKQRHFAHAPASDAHCSQETITHTTAKLMIQKVISDWKAGVYAAPVIVRICKCCRNHTEQPLPDKVQHALLEHRVSSGHIVDVALQVPDESSEIAAIGATAGKAVDVRHVRSQRKVSYPLEILRTGLAVEIRVSHRVDDSKASRLSVPFVELSGEAVIASPLKWRPLRDSLLPFTCRYCAHYWAMFKAEVGKIAPATEVPVPTAYYRYSISQCWRCQVPMLVFTWPGKELYTQDEPPPISRPWTIRYRYSPSHHGKYWANTCPHCSVLQSDFVLFCEPDGALFGLDCSTNSSEAFVFDIQWLALRWAT